MPRLITTIAILAPPMVCIVMNVLLAREGDRFVDGLLSSRIPGLTTTVWVTVITRCLLLDSELVCRPWWLVRVGNNRVMRLNWLAKAPGVRNVFTRRPLLTASEGKMPPPRGMKLTFTSISPLVCPPATLPLLKTILLSCIPIRLNSDPSKADPLVLPGLTTLMSLFERVHRL